MGKKNFKAIYRKVKQDHGKVSCKISYYSNDFDSSKNYAGIIIYGMKGKTSWINSDGDASGCKGRSFYIIILRTDSFPEQRAVGQGRVHHYPIEKILGSSIKKNEVLCGGFAYHNGQLKFSSIWLNQYDQMGLDGASGESDGDKYLSDLEKELVRYCFDQYKLYGKHRIFSLPDDLDRKLS